MTIQGIEFSFSALNANDMDRLNAATRQSKLDGETEKQRVRQGGITDVAEIIRGQCRILHTYLDTLLGAGACAKLGLDGSDLNNYRAVVEEVAQKVATELESLHMANSAAPAAQRRANPPHKRHKRRSNH